MTGFDAWDIRYVVADGYIRLYCRELWSPSLLLLQCFLLSRLIPFDSR